MGILGNTISLLVFRRKSLRKLSASFYLRAICVSDTGVLLTYVLLDWLDKGLPVMQGGQKYVTLLDYNVPCKLFLYFSYTFRIVSVWLIIVFTFERYVAICHPLQRRLICTRSFSYKIISAVIILAAILCLYKPILSGARLIFVNTYACSGTEEARDINFILDSIYGFGITLLPFVIITLFNSMILVTLRKRSDVTETRALSRESRMRREFTVILLAISTCFVCLNIPYFAVWTSRFQSIKSTTASSSSSSEEDYLNLARSSQGSTNREALFITRTVFYLNYAVNFVLYCITGKQYRQHMTRLLCCHHDDIGRGSNYRSGYTTHTYVPPDERNGHVSSAV